MCEILRQCVARADRLQQKSVIITFDQAIYAKAKEVVWKNPTVYKRIVLRMGAFHICSTYLAVLGKRFDDSGLRDLIIESGLVGPSAVNGKYHGKLRVLIWCPCNRCDIWEAL